MRRVGSTGYLREHLGGVICLGLVTGLFGCRAQQEMLIKISCEGNLTAQKTTQADVFSGYQQLLKEYVTSEGQVDFARWTNNDDARKKLDCFLAWAGAVNEQSNPEIFRERRQRRAFYINSYNACVLRGILEFYPLVRLHDCKTDFFSELYFIIASQRMSLYDLAQRSGINEDERVAFALGLPVRSGPVISNEIYQADTLETQLDEAVIRYLGSCHGMQIDHKDQQVLLGRLIMERKDFFLDYYRQKYGIGQVSLISALVPWAHQHTQEQLVNLVGYKTGRLRWDDTLIDVRDEEQPQDDEAEALPCGRM